VVRHDRPGSESARRPGRDPAGHPCGSRREPPRLFIEHQFGDRVWTHSQGAWEINGRELADDPGSAGLPSGRWLTADHA
jgi:hypothetical protein